MLEIGNDLKAGKQKESEIRKNKGNENKYGKAVISTIRNE